jgi:hypothetical protein
VILLHDMYLGFAQSMVSINACSTGALLPCILTRARCAASFSWNGLHPVCRRGYGATTHKEGEADDEFGFVTMVSRTANCLLMRITRRFQQLQFVGLSVEG